MIIITGGAGFIGSNLVAALEKRGEHELVVVDHLGRGDKWRNLAKRELAQLFPPEGLLPFLEMNRGRIKALFHMGAISSTTESNADLILSSNFTLTLTLWEWCGDYGVPFFYASSAATYGDGKQGFDDDGSSRSLARLKPLNAYGWSKHLADRRVARLVEEGGTAPPQWAGLKFFNVYGPNEYHKGDMRSVVVQLYPAALKGEPARLFRSHRDDVPDGGQKRDFIHVDDCVEMMLWLYDHAHVSGLFNIGSGEARSFAELASAVYRAVGREPAIDYVDTPPELREKYQYFTEARMDRLRHAGYRAKATPLEEGVARYIRDFLMKPDPYR
ncbi:MAG TPA: ADP-glyceromanno-heptose 6-epimerase [Stellaceae bacterium]|nr:ADP-glyceromanno-heptose 6-epimerase [Stellaceae bacterium]